MTRPANPTYEVEVWALAVVKARVRVLASSARTAVAMAEACSPGIVKCWAPVGGVVKPIAVDVVRVPAKPNGQRNLHEGD